MNPLMKPLGFLFGMLFAINTTATDANTAPAPSADIARRCLRYAYIVFPYKRPGSVRGSGDRQAYYRDCITKDGNVPEPVKN